MSSYTSQLGNKRKKKRKTFRLRNLIQHHSDRCEAHTNLSGLKTHDLTACEYVVCNCCVESNENKHPLLCQNTEGNNVGASRRWKVDENAPMFTNPEANNYKL